MMMMMMMMVMMMMMIMMMMMMTRIPHLSFSFYIKANLEMNKESFAAELVCLLDVASRPQDIAGFKAEIESFFIVGSARIDMIAKVMDLDNDIGTYSFDIPLLNNTQKAISEVTNSGGKRQRNTFLFSFSFLNTSAFTLIRNGLCL